MRKGTPMITAEAPSRVKEKNSQLARFDQFESTEASGNPSWLLALRRNAITRFEELGFPTTNHEEWRFTPITAIARLSFNPILSPSSTKVTAAQIAPFTFDHLKGNCLVFLDGHFSEKLSTLQPKDRLRIQPLSKALGTNSLPEQHLGRLASFEENAFAALNTAFFQDGVLIVIPKGETVQDPIHMLHVQTRSEPGSTKHPRHLIVAERDARLTLIEDYVSLVDGPYFTNAVTEIHVSEGAQVEHCRIQAESHHAYHIATVQAVQERNSRWISHSISHGASIARINIQTRFTGEGGDAILNGLYIGSNRQLVDHHTIVDHAKPHCTSHEFYHGVLDGEARGVFNGKIFVRKDAQKTDAKQTSRNLLLSDSATIDTKPQLEIFADDVKCTHGATVGQLNDDAIFYLRSRGIGLPLARQMLVHAFASEILERITIEPVRRELDQHIYDRLEEHAESLAVAGGSSHE